MQTSGLILDVYDDKGGSILRQVYPTQEDLPSMVKSAHALTPEETQRLPDDCFALVMLNGDQKLRKFACIDPGNTQLAVDYFLKVAHRLPVGAQKVAAKNLLTACGWYELEPPEKLAEVAGTDPMPNSAPADKKVPARKATIQKEGADIPPDTNEQVSGEQPASNPQAKPLKPQVDVTGKEPPKLLQKKEAQLYALRGRYPLDSYAQVKCAVDYFSTWGKRMPPADRREYCKNLVKRAEQLCIEVGETISKYGAVDYSSPEELVMAIDARATLLIDEVSRDALYKLASLRPSLNPDFFAQTLEEFDRATGLDDFWGRDLADPYFTTFGKEAQEDSIVMGNDVISNNQLKRFAMEHRPSVSVTFGPEFAEEFQKDPRALFDSLPIEQRRMLLRMVANGQPGQVAV